LTRKRHVFTDSTVIAGQNNTVPEDNFLFKDTPEFLRWGGPAGQLIREFDWAATPLGTIGLWPASLEAAVGMIVRSAVPMVLLWGPEGRLIYNAGYAALAGDHHPGLLGNAVNDAWPEAAEFHDHVLRVVLAGGSLSYTDYEQMAWRNRSGSIWITRRCWMTAARRPGCSGLCWRPPKKFWPSGAMRPSSGGWRNCSTAGRVSWPCCKARSTGSSSSMRAT
jgi:hypothetical protein